MRIDVVTPPEPFVELDEAKAHLRVRHNVEDDLISSYIRAACAHVDGPASWLGRAIGPQTLEMHLPAFGTCGWIDLPCPPAVEVEQINYVATDGNAAQLLPGDFELSRNLLRPKWPDALPAAAWRGPQGDTVRIRYRAGYEIAPEPIKVAVLLMVGDLYSFRETAVVGANAASVPMSATVETLLSPYRVFS
jgi:uncharacterized phiE125 gp8 family phage protein